MKSRRHIVGRAVVCAALAAGVFAAPVSAKRLAVVVTDAPVFVVTLNGDDDVSVDCSGGSVRVVANGSPTVYTTACNAVTALTVTAAGTFFTHTINLTAVSAVAFSALTSPHIIGGLDDDTIIGSPLPDVIDSDQGDDDIMGLTGVDTINAGIGDDVITGGAGDDVITGGPNLDQFNWAPGDGNDTVDGGADADHVAFDGSAASETITIVPNGPGFTITTSAGGSVTASNVETLAVRAFGSDDIVNTEALANTSQNLDGGDQATAFGDLLNLNVHGGCDDLSDLVFTPPVGQPITFVNFEEFSILEPCSVPAMPPAVVFLLGAVLSMIALTRTRRLRFA
jgi:hypothetical protein